MALCRSNAQTKRKETVLLVVSLFIQSVLPRLRHISTDRISFIGEAHPVSAFLK